MRRSTFVKIIIVCAVFFVSFSAVDKIFIHDVDLELIYESVILTVVLATVGIAAAKYYGDQTTNDVTRELKKMVSDLEKRLDTLESRLKPDKKTVE